MKREKMKCVGSTYLVPRSLSFGVCQILVRTTSLEERLTPIFDVGFFIPKAIASERIDKVPASALHSLTTNRSESRRDRRIVRWKGSGVCHRGNAHRKTHLRKTFGHLGGLGWYRQGHGHRMIKEASHNNIECPRWHGHGHGHRLFIILPALYCLGLDRLGKLGLGRLGGDRHGHRKRRKQRLWRLCDGSAHRSWSDRCLSGLGTVTNRKDAIATSLWLGRFRSGRGCRSGQEKKGWCETEVHGGCCLMARMLLRCSALWTTDNWCALWEQSRWHVWKLFFWYVHRSKFEIAQTILWYHIYCTIKT